MVILIVSDCQAKATRLRHLLAQSGYDCPFANVVPTEAAESIAGGSGARPDVILVVLAQDAERTHAAIARIRESSDAQILAVGPRDPNLILGALHAGANGYLDESGDLQAELAASLGRLSTFEQRHQALGHVTTVVGAGGGLGRTLLATNLAVSLAKRSGPCALLDFDVGGADVATCLNLKPRHSLADLCRNGEKLDRKMLEQSLVEHESGVWVLAAPDSWEEARHVTADGLQRVLRAGRSIFPQVVVDLNPIWDAEAAGLLQQSSLILLLLRLDFGSIRNARRALATFERLGIERSRVQLVATHYGRQKEISVAQAESALGTKIAHFIPEDPQTANSCLNCGVPAVMEAARSPIAKAIQAIVETIAQEPARSGPPQHAIVPGISLAGRVRSFLGMSLQELAQTT
jgi:pilus assembly protein CpaE